MSNLSPQDAPGWAAVVLAAGRGTRMRSTLPKPLHPVAGRPMVQLVCDVVADAGITRIVVVTAAAGDSVAQAVRTVAPDAAIAVQGEPLGTGHAALAAREAVGGATSVLVLNADLPLLTARTVRDLMERHRASNAALTFLTAYLEDPTGYGRVLRRNGRLAGIVEDSEADSATRGEPEVNAGLYAARADWLWDALAQVTPGPRGERYLTDIIGLAVGRGDPVQTCQIVESSEVQQVNTRIELARVEAAMRDRVRQQLMLSGVTLIDPGSTFVDVGVAIGPDTTLLPGVSLSGKTTVGAGSRIGPYAIVSDTRIGERCEVGPSVLDGATLGNDVHVGPYCHVRPGTHLEDGVHVGTHAEIKASRIGAGSRVNHFSYVGDADVGADVNIGAGTVVANYDGVAKHRTRIGDGAFIGSDSVLVAPIEVGAGAHTGAGAVVTHDVPAGETVVGVPAHPHPTAGREQ